MYYLYYTHNKAAPKVALTLFIFFKCFIAKKIIKNLNKNYKKKCMYKQQQYMALKNHIYFENFCRDTFSL